VRARVRARVRVRLRLRVRVRVRVRVVSRAFHTRLRRTSRAAKVSRGTPGTCACRNSSATAYASAGTQ